MKTLSFGQKCKLALYIAADAVKSATSYVFGLRSTLPYFGPNAGAPSRRYSYGRAAYLELAGRALRNPYVYRAYEIFAGALASIELDVQFEVERDGETELDSDPAHPFLMLLKRPSREQGRVKFFKELVSHLFFAGEAFLYAPDTPLTGQRAGRPSQTLRLLRPDRVQEIIRDRNDPETVTGYRYQDRYGKSKVLEAVRVLHIVPIEDPDDLDGRGYPLVLAVWNSVLNSENLEEWSNSVSEQRGQIPVIIEEAQNSATRTTLPGRPDGVELAKRQKALEESYLDKARRSVPWLMNPAYKISEQSKHLVKPDEAESLEREKFNGRKVAIGLGIGTSLLGDTERQTYSNLKAELAALYLLSVLPMLDLILDEMNRWYMPMYPEAPGRYLCYYRDSIDALQEDQTAKYDRLFKATGRPFLTPNEARSELDFDASTDPVMDEVWVPFNVLPQSQVAQPPETPAGGEITEEEEQQLALLIKSALYASDPMRSQAGGDGAG